MHESVLFPSIGQPNILTSFKLEIDCLHSIILMRCGLSSFQFDYVFDLNKVTSSLLLLVRFSEHVVAQ